MHVPNQTFELWKHVNIADSYAFLAQGKTHVRLTL